MFIYQVAMLILYGSATYIVIYNCHRECIAVKLLGQNRHLEIVGSLLSPGQRTYVKPLPVTGHLPPVNMFYYLDFVSFVFKVLL